jgi:ABC-type sugar transport system substrate-binding protein
VGQKLVVSLMTKDQEFQVLQAADAERAATRAGLELEIVYAKNNGRLQVEQLYPFINGIDKLRPAAIIAQAVPTDGLARVAADAAKRGIGWVLLNRDMPYIDTLRSEHATLPIAIVTIDQIAIGRIQGRQFRALLPRRTTRWRSARAKRSSRNAPNGRSCASPDATACPTADSAS